MTYLPKVKHVIADTKEHLELSTEELAKQLGVPTIQLEVWKRGYFDKEYYPLLILALIHLIDQQEKCRRY